MEARPVFKMTIPGRPQRWMRPGQYLDKRTGRLVRLTEKVPREHKEMVGREARKIWRGAPLTCPIVLECRFIFAIPKTWPPKVQQAAREGRLPHIMDPDIDQCCKHLMDSLTGIVYADDNQIWRFNNTFKRYGAPERSEIVVYACDQAEDEHTPGQARVAARQAQSSFF